MMKFIKNNIITILFLIFAIVIMSKSVVTYNKTQFARINLFKTFCQSEVQIDCNLSAKLAPLGTFHQFEDSGVAVLLGYILPLTTVLSVALYFSVRFKGYLKNELMRLNYKKVLRNHILKSYLKSLIFPLAGLLLVCITAFVSYNGHASGSLYASDPTVRYGIPPMFYNVEWLFYIIYFLCLTLAGIFIANLFIIISRYIKNVVTSIIVSYVSLMSLEIFMINFIGYGIAYFLYYVFKYDNFEIDNIYNSISINGVWYSDTMNPIFLLMYLLTIVIISSLIVKKVYQNKEQVVIAGEK